MASANGGLGQLLAITPLIAGQFLMVHCKIFLPERVPVNVETAECLNFKDQHNASLLCFLARDKVVEQNPSHQNQCKITRVMEISEMNCENN
jgi:hypothetical protein